MSSYNKVILCGHACRDAEEFKGLAKFSLATNRKRKNQFVLAIYYDKVPKLCSE
jgi:hypothetical protein